MTRQKQERRTKRANSKALRAGKAGGPYIRISEFPVKAGLEKRFETIYGADGDWVRLFRKGQGFLGTELYSDISQRGRYITLDYWTSEVRYEAFKNKFGAEYDALDLACQRFNQNEKPIGGFRVADSPRRKAERNRKATGKSSSGF